MFNILCFNKKEELIMASVDSDIDKDWLLTIGDDKYIVTSAGSTMHMMTGSNKIVELEKYKESKKKVG